MRKFNSLLKVVFLTVILLLCIFEVSVAAVYSPAPMPTQQRKLQTPQEKKQQLQQEATTAMTEVDTAYREILTSVNSGQAPSAEVLDKDLKIVAKNRKYLPVLTDSQKSEYHIFSAWVFYFDSKQDKALKQAVSAQKVAPKNPNTLKTRFALSVIYKDYASIAEAFTEQNAAPKPHPQNAAAGEEQQSSYQQSDSDIKLDVNAVKTELLGKAFDFNPEPVKADLPPWHSAGQVTAALLWKIDSGELDAFAPVVKPETNEPNAPVSFTPEPVAKSIPEVEAFSKIQTQFSDNKKTSFIGINLNDPAKKENLANWLKKGSHNWQACVLSTDQQPKLLSLLGNDSNKPILLVVAPDSTIRYAGSVEGFLPPMVIRGILQNPQEFVEPNEPNKPPAAAQLAKVAEPNSPAVKPAEQPAEPNKPVISPALPPAEVNKTVINTQQPKPVSAPNTVSIQVKHQADEELAAADDYQAQTLLSNAKTFLQIGSRLPSHEYRNPVEWCRRVIKDYPNTKYAQEAQMLLRNVPKEYRQQYNITDQELGL